jgi:hypothetical protein
MLLVDFTDPYEITAGYTTAQWRTAQFAVGSLDLSKFSFTPSGYLLISPERNGTEPYQEKGLTMYVDDVKLLPLSTTGIELLKNNFSFTGYYDSKSGRVCVLNLPENTRKIRVYDVMGRFIDEVLTSGNVAMVDINSSVSSVFIVQVLTSDGNRQSIKVIR